MSVRNLAGYRSKTVNTVIGLKRDKIDTFLLSFRSSGLCSSSSISDYFPCGSVGCRCFIWIGSSKDLLQREGNNLLMILLN